MSDEKALVPIEQKQVVFYEDEITAVLVNAERGQEVYVPIRPICEMLGIDWPSQSRRIKRDAVLAKHLAGVVVMTTPDPLTGGGGPQTASCLPLDYLNGWLFGINANRVNPEIKDRLIRYQEECYRVLAEAFREGRLTADTSFSDLLNEDSPAAQAYKMAAAIMQMARQQILLENRVEAKFVDYDQRLESIETALGNPDHVITADQAMQISQAIKAVAMVLTKQSGSNQYGSVYGEMYRKFGITGYKLLPARKFQEAIEWLTDWHQDLTSGNPF